MQSPTPTKHKIYKELLKELHSKDPNPMYYTLLISNARLVLTEIAIRNQGQVALDLNMTTSKLSNIVGILKEYANNPNYKDSVC